MSAARNAAGGWRIVLLAVQAVAGALGLAMLALGIWLILLGGSVYYAAAGALLLAGAIVTWRGDHGRGLAALAAALALSFGWALWEVAGKGWQPVWAIDLATRVGVIAALAAVACAAWLLGRGDRRQRRVVYAGAGVAVAVAIGGVALAWERPITPGGPVAAVAYPADTDWTAFGGTNAGERFSPAAQVTPANVATLREAWRFHTGDAQPGDRVFYAGQNTPLKIGDSLFLCSPGNKVFALDPATGAERWRFDPRVAPRAMESMFSAACRAVGYHARADASDVPCARRVFVAAADGRLIALDAARGQRCTGFGRDGTVDLTAGMGLREPGHASSNSGPAGQRQSAPRRAVGRGARL